jgi:hypothetical protein
MFCFIRLPKCFAHNYQVSERVHHLHIYILPDSLGRLCIEAQASRQILQYNQGG